MDMDDLKKNQNKQTAPDSENKPEEIESKKIPICKIHQCRMISRATNPKGDKKRIYYKCPIANCNEKGAETALTVFEKPHYCNLERCNDGKGNFPAREYSEVKSDGQMMAMVCPNCGNTIKLERPQVTQFHMEQHSKKKLDFNSGRTKDYFDNH